MDDRGYDPLLLGKNVEKQVCRKTRGVVERRYYRFRGGRWYGGIATADCVGCNLRCRFCWSWRMGSFALTTGSFYTPSEVARRLEGIARKRGYRSVRISGGEPVLCIDHLLSVLDELSGSRLVFVLETNGILLGSNAELADKIAAYDNVVVRVSIKAASPEEYYRVTGAMPSTFEYQIKALENLVKAGLKPGERVYPALMLSFSSPQNIKTLIEKIYRIHPDLVASLDPEVVIMYPHVRELLRRYGLKPVRYIDPNNIPRHMV